MDLELDDGTALVTASSSGLGKACARALASEGASVVCNGRDPDRLEDAVAELDGLKGSVTGVTADLTDPDAIDALVSETASTFGGLDHLVTNIAGPSMAPALDVDDETWHGAYERVFLSALRTIRAAAPLLRDGGGSIVMMTSRTTREVIEKYALSNVFRLALVGLNKTLAKELAPSIRVNAIAPGPFETGRIETLVEESLEQGQFDSRAAAREAWAEDVPLGRPGEPSELGDLVAYLASDRASYVTGATIPIDGGATDMPL
jgi:3-oxoacyl-[acyl-carrier protein] reductase